MEAGIEAFARGDRVNALLVASDPHRVPAQGVTDVELQFIFAGSLALVAAGIHGVAGEVIVVRKLSLHALPSTAFGGPWFTRSMIRVTWHLVTISFLTLGVALIVTGRAPRLGEPGDRSRRRQRLHRLLLLGLVVGFPRGGFRSSWRHPAPLLFALVAGLTWGSSRHVDGDRLGLVRVAWSAGSDQPWI